MGRATSVKENTILSVEVKCGAVSSGSITCAYLRLGGMAEIDISWTIGANGSARDGSGCAATGDVSGSMAGPCPSWANAGSPEAKIALSIHFALMVFLLETTAQTFHDLTILCGNTRNGKNSRLRLPSGMQCFSIN
jgi:hypothetical protein